MKGEKAKEALLKLGLRRVEDITRVVIRRPKSVRPHYTRVGARASSRSVADDGL